MMLCRIVKKVRKTPPRTITTTNHHSNRWNSKFYHHGYVSINGDEIDNPEDAKISIWDQSFHRGDGVFEVMKLMKSGRIRSLEHHLQRLQTSADNVGCPLPSKNTLIDWLNGAALACFNNQISEGHNKGILRVIATKGGGGYLGSDFQQRPTPSSVIISWSPLPQWPSSFTLFPLVAPWHPAGYPGWEVPIKWLSYGPNVVSTQKAQHNGFTDAILLGSDRIDPLTSQNQSSPILDDCYVLDGPNFAIGWISKNTCFFPCSASLGLLPSITQKLVVEKILLNDEASGGSSDLGLKVEYGVYPLSDLLSAEEVFVMSTTRGVIPVTQIGDNKLLPAEKQNRVALLSELLTYITD